jgi:hypothetical protein
MTITLKPMMKRAAIVLAGVLVLVIWSAQAPAAVSRVRCAPRHDRVLARDGVGELYEAPLEFVCAFGRYRAHGIGGRAAFSSQGGGGIVDPSLGGGYVAYGEESADNEGGLSSYVIVQGIRTGRVFREVPAAYPEVPISAEEGGPTYGVVVKPDGSVAWIVQNPADHFVFEVHVVDHRGARVVAIGVTPNSLRLHGSTISWVLADKRVSTTLY